MAFPLTPSAGPAESVRLHATLRELQRAAQVGTLARSLRGKHVCLLGSAPDNADAASFREAAQELGAQVTALDAARLVLSSETDVARCGRMLGRLYDAVECEGLEPGLVDGLRESAGVPVYDGLALDRALVARLYAGIAEAPSAEQRRRALQAVLVSALV